VDHATRGRVAQHPWVQAAGAAGLYVVRLKFVRPLAVAVKDAAAAAARRVRTRRPGSPK
jgi:hypothetical protein